ncbi:Replication-relaxation [Bradyrhizobium yuanmingense]|uniref:Replication-relaxation n=2 Tax=Bradyrhizobium yuanmingense TaxID=108015 RepID=A0A1C3XMX9_9BRAD|nr:protein involved in plasmid replication-relaxation [Bradyrhizobium yuanmingense]SCB53515.1 Replication-relaxation [Bradyrhizobium yuanmingense]
MRAMSIGRAQLDYYPTSGSAPMVYALGDLGAQLLSERGAAFAHCEWSRKNGEAGRPFIEHQLEIVELHIALERSTRGRSDVRLIPPEEIIASSPECTRKNRNPFALRATISQSERAHDIAVVPDLVFGFMFPDGSRRCFMVEIDRGTMPISRSDFRQTSFERKMHAYLAAYGQGQHMKQFGWKTFRVLVVTTDQQRARSMIERLQQLNVPQSPGPSLFFFALAGELQRSDPLAHNWQDGGGRATRLNKVVDQASVPRANRGSTLPRSLDRRTAAILRCGWSRECFARSAGSLLDAFDDVDR